MSRAHERATHTNASNSGGGEGGTTRSAAAAAGLVGLGRAATAMRTATSKNNNVAEAAPSESWAVNNSQDDGSAFLGGASAVPFATNTMMRWGAGANVSDAGEPNRVRREREREDHARYREEKETRNNYGGEEMQEEEPEKFEAHFAKYLSEDQDPTELEERMEEVFEAIREDPEFTKKERTKPKDAGKLFKIKKLTYEERKANLKKKLEAMRAGAEEEDDEDEDE